MWDNAACLGPRMGCPPCCLQCLKPVDGSYRCEICGWPVCDETCAKGKAHQIECQTLKNAKEKVMPVTYIIATINFSGYPQYGTLAT